MSDDDRSFEETLALSQVENVKETIKKAMGQMGIEFKMETAQSDPKVIVTIFGKKGDSKTSIGLGFPGTIGAISLDRKTASVWEELYNKAPRIKVYDGVEYLNDDPDFHTLTSSITHEYILYLLIQQLE